ncbi:MAG TPA: ATP-dependent DNA helicase [Solirubrobacteraceae bacterium]|nr:ATP-dependent DNA helicase [Solirubrobacteraceae bacterium]
MGPPPDDLLPAQRRAVTYPGQSLVVLGAAGTGKTRVLVERFLWLVGQGTRPEKVALVAASDGRADALRERIERNLAGGYDELVVATPVQLAAVILDASTGGDTTLESTLSASERFALLMERIDELPLERHDFGGSARALLTGFLRRIDRLKAHLITAEDYARWAASLDDRAEPGQAALEREFSEVYRAHERILVEAGVRDTGDLVFDALRLIAERPSARRFDHVLVDDAHELDPGPARLTTELSARGITVAADPVLGGFTLEGAEQIGLERSLRCPEPVLRATAAMMDIPVAPAEHAGAVSFWRCAGERAQAQSVAADVERVLTRDGVAPGRVAILVPSLTREGQAVAVALEERAVPHHLLGAAAFFQRAEIRDLLAWLRLLADASDAAAAVRVLARPPIELRSVDIARCIQIARRRKLDMIAALAAATEAPQVPPEARERIRVLLKLYRAGMAAFDTTRPDLYVHRLIDRLGLRRHQLFAAQADVVQRLRALARFGELAAAYARRSPQATPRQFARFIAAVAESGSREQDESDQPAAGAVQVVALDSAAPISAEHVYVLGLHAALALPALEPIPAALRSRGRAGSQDPSDLALRRSLYVAFTRTAGRLVVAYPDSGGRGAALRPCPPVESARLALGEEWEDKSEELFGPAEMLHSTYRLLRDEVLQDTMRVGGRLGELRLDTDLDVSHAIVRYLELLKLAALIQRPEGQSLAEALRDVNARILQAVTAEQREILTSSALDDYLLDAERDVRRRAQVVQARDEPSLELFLPKRGEGVLLSASDIDTYRTCPLKYKFARVFRIPQEPSIHQRFGILVHQVLERFHAREGAAGTLPQLLGLLDAGWRRAGFADTEEERQLRGKAVAALERYWERFRAEDSEPVWFERSFTFKLGPHLLRGRVDRVDRLPTGQYELIDYKTGRPKTSEQLADDVQLSLYAVAAREAWSLDSSTQAYYYVLDDRKVAVPVDQGDRSEWIREVALEVAGGILSQGFEPTPSYAACSVCDYRLMCPAAER